MIIFAASSRLWCKFVSISCRLSFIFFRPSACFSLVHLELRCSCLVCHFNCFTSSEVSFVADFSPRDLFDSLVIFCCFCICFVGSWCCLAWSIRFLLLLSNLVRWSRNMFLDKLTVLRFLFNLRAAVLFMTPRLLDVDSNLRVKALLDISFTGCSLGERSHTGITVTQLPLCYKCKHFSSQLELQIPLE